VLHMLQCDATYCIACCSALQCGVHCVALCCTVVCSAFRVLQCVAVCCSVFHSVQIGESNTERMCVCMNLFAHTCACACVTKHATGTLLYVYSKNCVFDVSFDVRSTWITTYTWPAYIHRSVYVSHVLCECVRMCVCVGV